MINPFEDIDRNYVVLRNQRGEHSLWPTGIATPAGWVQVFGENSRARCLSYVETHWTDLCRPTDLADT